ncbi:MAG: hypothetical protein ACRD7E_02420 [Bryobacteraceae bacterium]
MSDYMFMLENHLTSHQSRMVTQVVAAAADANVNLFLTGGAVRDMLGGFPIRDLDFTVEGNAIKLAKAIAQKAGARIVFLDENRKSAELVFPGAVTAQIAMARLERYTKTGGKPHVTPATIHEDLRGRDFTINALALSLNRASRGLLLDPTNGLADLERKELRAIGNYIFYDDPVRLLRLIRFRVRFGFEVAERTQTQYQSAREAQAEQHVSSRLLLEELRQIASEPNLAETLEALESEGLLRLVSPAVSGPKLNLAGFSKLQKARQLIPFEAALPVDNVALLFYFLTEKLTPKERSQAIRSIGMGKAEMDAWQKLEVRARKAEKEIASAKFQKPSQVYQLMSKFPGEQLLFLLAKSSQRLVLDRIRNYLQKYLAIAQEVTDKDVVEAGATAGTPKFQKLKQEMIARKLDARPKKVPAEVPVETSAAVSSVRK